MEEMDVFVSKEEVKEIARKLKAEHEEGDWIVVFYIEERVFGIVPSSTISFPNFRHQNVSIETFQKVTARYGSTDLEVLYFYRGTSDEKMESFAKELDKTRRINKRQPTNNTQTKRVRKKKQFAEYEVCLTEGQSAPQQKENTSLPAPAQRSKKLKKDVRKTAPAINNEPDVRNMAMMAGFSGLMDAIHPLSTLEPSSQLESLSSLLAESREELEGLETQSEKIRRLEAQLEVEKSKVLELQLKLIEKEQIPDDVKFHISALMELLSKFQCQGASKSSFERLSKSDTVVNCYNPSVKDADLPTSPLQCPLPLTPPDLPSTSQPVLPPAQKVSAKSQPLIVDPKNNGRFASVKVDTYKLYQLEQYAVKKNNPYHLLNGIIKLVFSQLELASCSGLGLRTNGSGTAGPNPLEQVKVLATKEYMRSALKKYNWTPIDEKDINRKFTCQITNARRDLKILK
ncbi:uncharacterized protein [Apostichopus japonicus]|uniref:uncharacterized protein n=1 Tax=Stichopus japonicus TaxID=307972 RepID=UPI003AB57B67